MLGPAALSVLALAASSLAMPVESTLVGFARGLQKRCNAYNKGLPTATGTSTSSSVITIKAGVTFDGKVSRLSESASHR